MITACQSKSASFLRIIVVLQRLRDQGVITEIEYQRAKQYYKRLTGADIVVLNYPKWSKSTTLGIDSLSE